MNCYSFARLAFACLAILTALPTASGLARGAEPLRLHLRSRVETAAGSGQFQVSASETEWDPAKTAIIVCDMWDRHWCRGATERVAEMAPRMNEVLKAARRRGV
ncbi:MAG TPA: hypothetical protein VHB99_06355, partial [Pirellulales bacterium]|nr:hypothetical protein [Pirellulales bacterium]